MIARRQGRESSVAGTVEDAGCLAKGDSLALTMIRAIGIDGPGVLTIVNSMTGPCLHRAGKTEWFTPSAAQSPVLLPAAGQKPEVGGRIGLGFDSPDAT